MLVLSCLLLAWLLRFDFTFPHRSLLYFAAALLVPVRVSTLACFGLLRGWWRYAGIRDGIDVLKAVSLGSLLFWLILHYVLAVQSFPRSIYLLEPVLTAGGLVGVRLLSRALAESVRQDLKTCKKVIIVGAGFCAQQILREITRPESGYVAIGCLDDDHSKVGVRIHGIPVLSTVDKLPFLVSRYAVNEVLIAIPSATSIEMRRFIEICSQAQVKFRTVPALKDVIADKVSISELREVNLDDLLDRQPIRIDLDSVEEQIAGRTVVVTGAAGSIGSELCRQILDYNPARLVCLDQNESGLFYLQQDLARHKNGSNAFMCVVDITDCERLRNLLSVDRPNLLFHAAAYKHVPLMEENIYEAVKNNVFGFIELLNIAEDSGCNSVVLISSDKAVNPTSVMGATKRICEMILSSRSSNGMRCVSVRFGNVLGSSGSVVPILKQQLARHQPLTITHPEVRRFFMTTVEAVALVLQAFVIGRHGDVLVLDMGEPVRILDLARTLARLAGLQENTIQIEFTGLRPGEKLEEELFYSTERILPTAFEKIKRTQGHLLSWPELQHHLNQLRIALKVNDCDSIRAKIREIVPQYQSQMYFRSKNRAFAGLVEERQPAASHD